MVRYQAGSPEKEKNIHLIFVLYMLYLIYIQYISYIFHINVESKVCVI